MANETSLKVRNRGRVAVAPAFLAAIAFVLAVAPPASADNASFLAAMDGLGLSSEDGAEGLLRAGKGACSLLRPDYGLMFGRHPNLVAEKVWQANPMLERREAALIANAAIDNLCPRHPTCLATQRYDPRTTLTDPCPPQRSHWGRGTSHGRPRVLVTRR